MEKEIAVKSILNENLWQKQTKTALSISGVVVTFFCDVGEFAVGWEIYHQNTVEDQRSSEKG
jgi:hypothetical protein